MPCACRPLVLRALGPGGRPNGVALVGGGGASVLPPSGDRPPGGPCAARRSIPRAAVAAAAAHAGAACGAGLGAVDVRRQHRRRPHPCASAAAAVVMADRSVRMMHMSARSERASQRRIGAKRRTSSIRCDLVHRATVVDVEKPRIAASRQRHPDNCS